MKVAKRPKLRMRWFGAPPRPGQYLASDGPRARTAYRIIAADWKWVEHDERWHATVTVERARLDEIPHDRNLHRFRRDARTRKRRGRAPVL